MALKLQVNLVAGSNNMVINIVSKQMGRCQRWLLLSSFISSLALVMISAGGCSKDSSSDESLPESPSSSASIAVPAQAGVPLVTMDHWKNSTPGERYAFLIGFVTMLELEKEWQGRDGQGILSFEESLVPSWVEGFAHRPLAEIYDGLNRHVTDYPDELERPAAEVMWFDFIEPRLKGGKDSKFSLENK